MIRYQVVNFPGLHGLVTCLILPEAGSFRCRRSSETSFHTSLMQSTPQPMYLLHSNTYKENVETNINNTNHCTLKLSCANLVVNIMHVDGLCIQ